MYIIKTKLNINIRILLFKISIRLKLKCLETVIIKSDLPHLIIVKDLDQILEKIKSRMIINQKEKIEDLKTELIKTKRLHSHLKSSLLKNLTLLMRYERNLTIFKRNLMRQKSKSQPELAESIFHLKNWLFYSKKFSRIHKKTQ